MCQSDRYTCAGLVRWSKKSVFMANRKSGSPVYHRESTAVDSCLSYYRMLRPKSMDLSHVIYRTLRCTYHNRSTTYAALFSTYWETYHGKANIVRLHCYNRPSRYNSPRRADRYSRCNLAIKHIESRASSRTCPSYITQLLRKRLILLRWGERLTQMSSWETQTRGFTIVGPSDFSLVLDFILWNNKGRPSFVGPLHNTTEISLSLTCIQSYSSVSKHRTRMLITIQDTSTHKLEVCMSLQKNVATMKCNWVLYILGTDSCPTRLSNQCPRHSIHKLHYNEYAFTSFACDIQEYSQITMHRCRTD